MTREIALPYPGREFDPQFAPEDDGICQDCGEPEGGCPCCDEEDYTGPFNAEGWPLWTLHFTVGRHSSRTSFFAADRGEALRRALRWVEDYEVETDRKAHIVDVTHYCRC